MLLPAEQAERAQILMRRRHELNYELSRIQYEASRYFRSFEDLQYLISSAEADGIRASDLSSGSGVDPVTIEDELALAIEAIKVTPEDCIRHRREQYEEGLISDKDVNARQQWRATAARAVRYRSGVEEGYGRPS